MRNILTYILLMVCLGINGTPQTPPPAPKFGYTTNYGYGFDNRSYTSGYPQKSYGNSNPTSGYHGGPRRSPEHPNPTEPPTYNPFSTKFWNWYNSEAGQDWIRINGSPWGIIADPDPNWPEYVSDDWWGWFIENYSQYEDEAALWFYERGQTPPWMTPIGDPVLPILSFLLLYTGYCFSIKPRVKG